MRTLYVPVFFINLKLLKKIFINSEKKKKHLQTTGIF